MPNKSIQLRESLARSVRELLNFKRPMKFFESRWHWSPLTWGYEAMLSGLAADQRNRLKTLTLEQLDMAALSKLPPGTFGREYVDFFKQQHVSATSYVDAWPAMTRVLERSWVVRRTFKLHDMHHVLLGFSCDHLGEWGITAFTVRNSREPNNCLALIGLPIGALLLRNVFGVLRAAHNGWRMAGHVHENLFHAPLEEMFDQPLDEVRRKCGISLPEVAAQCARAGGTRALAPRDAGLQATVGIN
jgi:ubiquinone biosynthesis protein Coq4